jgi:hypothetical protein
LSSQHVEHCKGYGYKVIGKVASELTTRFLKDEREMILQNFVDKPLNMFLKICKCNKCHEEFMLLKIDFGTSYYEKIYSSKIPL